eukprot:COSAG04_NODE_3784_length_2534_cov_16.639425_2_plen_283_part_00
MSTSRFTILPSLGYGFKSTDAVSGVRLFVTACQKLKLVVGAGLLSHRCYAVVFAAVALGQLERLDELVAYRVAAACVSPPCSCLHSNECRSFHTGSELTIWDRVLSATLCYSYLCHSVPLYASTIQPHPGGGESEKSALCPCPSVSPELPTHSVLPTPGNFYVNLPPLFLGHFSPIFARFFPVFSPFAPSCRQDSGNRRQDPKKRSATVEKRRAKNPKLTLILTGVGTSSAARRARSRRTGTSSRTCAALATTSCASTPTSSSTCQSHAPLAKLAPQDPPFN